MTRIFTTDSAPPNETTEYWVDALCDAYVKLSCEPLDTGSGKPFEGHIHQNQISAVDVSIVEGSAQNVQRTRPLIARSAEDVFIVSIQAQGRSLILQDDREAELQPGDFAMYDSTRPYSLLYPDGLHQITLKVPRQLLIAQLPNAESLTAMKVSGLKGAGHLMINMIRTLLADIDDLDPISYDAISASVVDILTAGLRSLGKDTPPPLSTLANYHVQRIQAYVREHLHEPSLSVQSTAQALQLSISSIYRILESQGVTLSDWIWTQRLDRCRRDLADPLLVNLTVTQIGFRWGFSDASHLSRMFKRVYGLGPRDFRVRTLGSAQA